MVAPLTVSMVLYLGIILAAYFAIVPNVSAWVEHLSVPRILALLGANLLYGFLLFFGSGFLFLTLAAVCCSTLFDRLSYEVESLVTGNAPKVRLSWTQNLGDLTGRTFAVLLGSVIGIGCGWTCLGVAGFLVACLFSLWDYTAAYYLRRGITFGIQFSRCMRIPRKAGFMLTGGLLTLVPVLNVLMLPAMVAGGTLMAMDGEREGRW